MSSDAELLPATCGTGVTAVGPEAICVVAAFWLCLILEPASPGSLGALLPAWLALVSMLGDWALGEP